VVQTALLNNKRTAVTILGNPHGRGRLLVKALGGAGTPPTCEQERPPPGEIGRNRLTRASRHRRTARARSRSELPREQPRRSMAFR
jgi:hypothetical protein